MEDCQAWENVFQFVCGLSDDGAVKVFQHFTSVRIGDPTLDLSKTIPDEENEADVSLCGLTYRHQRFIDLVDGCFLDVQSKAALGRYWLGCNVGIILITPYRLLREDILKMTLVNEIASGKAVWCYCKISMSSVEDFQEFFGCLHVPLRITENSPAPLIRDFLRQFGAVRCERLQCEECRFDCVLRFHNGKAQFYITELELWCDDHVRLFTETFTISTPSRSANLCSVHVLSCLKFLRYIYCSGIKNAQNVKDLGAFIRNCKHLKTIRLGQFGDAV